MPSAMTWRETSYRGTSQDRFSIVTSVATRNATWPKEPRRTSREKQIDFRFKRPRCVRLRRAFKQAPRAQVARRRGGRRAYAVQQLRLRGLGAWRHGLHRSRRIPGRARRLVRRRQLLACGRRRESMGPRRHQLRNRYAYRAGPVLQLRHRIRPERPLGATCGRHELRRRQLLAHRQRDRPEWQDRHRQRYRDAYCARPILVIGIGDGTERQHVDALSIDELRGLHLQSLGHGQHGQRRHRHAFRQRDERRARRGHDVGHRDGLERVA